MDSLSQSVYQNLTQVIREHDSESVLVPDPKFPQPMSSSTLTEKIRVTSIPDKETLIVVNDHYRSTPSQRVLEELRSLQDPYKGLTIIIATGTHQPLTLPQARKFVHAREQDTVLLHSVYGDTGTEFVYKGTTTRGTEVYTNKVLDEFSHVLTINGVEPHYFAGFTGGVKSIVPGLSAKETTVANHKWALHPDSMGLRTRGNPVFEDLWEAGELSIDLESVQSIQLVNHGGTVFSINTGPLPSAFEKARQEAVKVYGIPVPSLVDHVITLVEPPLNKNLYQAHKAMENTKQVIKDGGTLTLVSSCHEGIGTRAFYDRMLEFGSINKILESITLETYHFGDHKAYKWAELASRVDLEYVGDLSDEEVQAIFMTKTQVNELVEQVRSWLRKGETILIDKLGGYAFYYHTT